MNKNGFFTIFCKQSLGAKIVNFSFLGGTVGAAPSFLLLVALHS